MLGADALYLTARGYGMSEPASTRSLYLAGVVELGLDIELAGAWSMRLAADLMAAALRREFAIRNVGVVHQPGAWSGRLWVGTHWHF